MFPQATVKMSFNVFKVKPNVLNGHFKHKNLFLRSKIKKKMIVFFLKFPKVKIHYILYQCLMTVFCFWLVK